MNLKESLMANDGRKLYFILFLLTLSAAIFSFRETLLSMMHIWYTSEDYQHGMLIIPISLYVIWGKRHALKSIPFNTSITGLVATVIICVIWFIGDIADIQLVTHFALMSLISTLVLACLGLKVFSALIFPLGYLLLAIPTHGPFVYPLQQITAEFVYYGLQITGIPFYREGQLVHIPAGTFEVAEACSGIRFLTSTFTLSILFTYLSYRTYKKRFVFLALAIIIPIIANGLRAFLTVLAGHYISMETAGGADHIIFGWQFFGLIMFLMFWIGSRWADKPKPEASGH